MEMFVPHRPRCCGCGRLSTGRICYMGSKDRVVDNPFCEECYLEVYFQTGKLLDEIFGLITIEGDHMFVQRWKLYEQVPSMPTKVEVMVKGYNRRNV